MGIKRELTAEEIKKTKQKELKDKISEAQELYRKTKKGQIRIFIELVSVKIGY